MRCDDVHDDDDHMKEVNEVEDDCGDGIAFRVVYNGNSSVRSIRLDFVFFWVPRICWSRHRVMVCRDCAELSLFVGQRESKKFSFSYDRHRVSGNELGMARVEELSASEAK